jgi:Ca2+-binding RTX toxin-like protein
MATKAYVFEENEFYGAQNIDGGGKATVENDAYITATGDNAIEVVDGPWTIQVDGYVKSNLNGMAFYDVTGVIANSKMTVGPEASIIGGTGFSGISTALAIDLTNAGVIKGGKYGILYDDINHSTTKTVSITNLAGGEILGDTMGIYLSDENHDLILKNAGTIDEVWYGRGATITNSGSIVEIYETSSTQAYNNTITNTGDIQKSVSTGHGDDKITSSGSIGTSVSMNNGNNTLTNSGTIGDSVYANEGNDTLTNSGIISDFVTLGDGMNKVTNSGNIYGYLDLGDGNDTVANTGYISNYVALEGGDNTLTNGGQIELGVTGGTGKTTITNSGSIGDDVAMGNTELILKNSGSIDGSVTLSGGKITLTNSGNILGEITGLGSADDAVTNSKLITGDISLGDGKNTVTNSGVIQGHVTTGSGSDTIKVTGNGQILERVYLGSGDDKFFGGNLTDFVEDDYGNDTYSLGGGNDHFRWLARGNDTVDGGAGTFDQFSGEPLGATALKINLDTKAVTIGANTLAASSAVAGAGTATVKGFECIYGSSVGDVIAGSAGNDTLLGLDGADSLYGNKGADHFYGGAADDTFVYLSVIETGTAKTTRDVIHDFQGANAVGGDVIDLSAIDADTKTTGDQAFDLIGGNTSFTGAAGDLRWVHQDGITLIQGDVNGDMKADFSIEVVGIVNFVGGANGDFKL